MWDLINYRTDVITSMINPIRILIKIFHFINRGQKVFTGKYAKKNNEEAQAVALQSIARVQLQI